MNHEKRQSRFTSSKIHLLIPKGKVKMTPEEIIEWKKDNPKSRVTTKAGGFNSAGLTYIEEKNLERKLGRGMSLNVYSRAIAWGHLMERVCYEKLEMYYDLVSNETISHHDPEFADIWRGSPDYIVGKQAISEQKSYQLKNFALYSDCLMKKDVHLFKEEFAQEYWQIVSNCCINNLDVGEAISFMPYKTTLEQLRINMNATDILDQWGYGEELWKYRFIHESDIRDLPYIKEGGYFKEITKFRFVIPDEDKIELADRVREASKLINIK